MKQLTRLLIYILSSCTLTAQNTELVGDTIQIELKGYTEGQTEWQYSPNKTTWNSGDTLYKKSLVVCNGSLRTNLPVF